MDTSAKRLELLIWTQLVRNQAEAACSRLDLFMRRRRLKDDWFADLEGQHGKVVCCSSDSRSPPIPLSCAIIAAVALPGGVPVDSAFMAFR